MNVRQILIPIFGFGKSGGDRVLSELANNWMEEGCHVDFLAMRGKAKPYFSTKAGIRIFDSNGVCDDPSIPRDLKMDHVDGHTGRIWVGMYRALSSIGSQYDIIVANHSWTTFPVAIARTGRAGKFYYIQAYEPEYYRSRGGFKGIALGTLSAMSYLLPLRQIANAPIYVGYKGIKADCWIPPGIDRKIFYQRDDLPTPNANRGWTIGTIGRHELYKGTRYVLDAFERLAKTDPCVRLKVAFGNLPAGWAHARVDIVVPSNDIELANFYRSVDVLVAVGTVQLGACHYPVLEAMACGTPVITTGYLPADTSNAWIVPVGDSEAIVSAVEEIHLASSESLERKINRAVNATKSFSWKEVAGRFLTKFDKVRSGR